MLLHKGGQAGGAGCGLNPPPSSFGKVPDKRAKRDRLERLAKTLTSTHVGLRWCGYALPLPPGEEGSGVEVRMVHEGDHRHAFFHRLQHCGSPYVCPDCGAWLAVRRADEIAQAAARWAGDGGQLVLATFTLRHRWGERLEDLLKRMGRAWRYMVGTRAWKGRVHYAGFIRSLEVTLGPNGWHPHYHVLFLFWDEVPTAEEVFSLWSHAVAREGGDAVPEAFSWEIVPAVDAQEVGHYVAKWGPGLEVAGGRFKDSAGLTPWEVLELAGLEAGLIEKEVCGHPVPDGIPQKVSWVELWTEYTSAVRGLRSVYWSRGLRELLSLKTDEELLEEGPEDSEIVGVLGLEDYERLRRAYLRNAFLGAVELYGWGAGLVVLSLAPPLPSGLPPPPPPSETTLRNWRAAQLRLARSSGASGSVADRPRLVQPPLFGEELATGLWLVRECGLE